MSDNTAFLRFSRAVERTPDGGRLVFADLVDLSESVGISLFEASTVLDTLVARGMWQREYLDGDGNPVAEAYVIADAARHFCGTRCGYEVAWRRGAGRTGYLLA